MLGVIPGINRSPFVVGEVRMYCGSTVPTGWLECDGSNYNDGDYPALENVIGTTFGATGGAGTWDVPDFRGRTPIGAGTGSGLTARSLGDTPGAETHQLSVSEMPAHDHSGGVTIETAVPGVTGDYGLREGTVGAGHATSATVSSQGGDGAHNNMQPSLCVKFIIRAVP